MKKRRLQLHLMQKDVAQLLGVHVESLKNWERDVGSPLIRQIPRIIAFLGYDPEPEPQLLSGRIAYVRRRLGLTQEDLAKALAIDPVTVYRWEKGLSTPPATKLRLLTDLLPAGSGLTLP